MSSHTPQMSSYEDETGVKLIIIIIIIRANYLAYVVRHPLMKRHPPPLGHGWELVDGRCRPVRYTRPALPTLLPTVGPVEESEEDKSDEEDDDVHRRRMDSSESEDSECDDETESSDSD